MFKKPPTLKPSTPLRSSSRRAFVAHLQALYPILALVEPEILLKVVPSGLKQCSALTSSGQKAVIYLDEHGKPLWFELGSEAGAALQQAQQKKGEKNGKPAQEKSKMAEVFPTVYTLWVIPNLLPRLPTWPQIVDPTLFGGSALMIPGLIPPPHTFTDIAQDGALPPASSIIAITAYPSQIPLVVARSELDIKSICERRALGEKGKAAATIHAKGDYLWEMGGKGEEPSEEALRSSELSLLRDKTVEGEKQSNSVEQMLNEVSLSDHSAAQQLPKEKQDIENEKMSDAKSTFTVLGKLCEGRNVEN
jgi:translation initiation factor 2D